ncbi:MAG: UDP-glucose 4-epimerase GalE [Clostridiales bacterium]|jgi:UDP-glucose 4-epimerase|nr:UDP-glucose 4-epimerase GalE [Clostridiales bacterium]
MAVLVCGGAGYIGSFCVRELKKAGYECIVYDNLSEGHRSAVNGFTLIEGDLLESVKLGQVFSNYNIEGVIHFAAFALVGESMKTPVKYYENNLSGTVNLVKEMEKAKVKNIIFSSTCAVYGETTQIPINEETAVNPCNPYGQTKLAVEQFLRWCDIAYGTKSVCLRYFNAAGAAEDGSIGEDHLLETHLIPLIYRVALGQSEKIHIFGGDYATPDGSCIRDYIHVKDLAGAHVKALNYLTGGGNSQVLNLGTGKGVSVLEMINAAKKITGKDIPYDITARREGDPAELVASCEKAKNVLGWEAAYSGIETILSDAWLWHSTHPNGYGDRANTKSV